MVAKYGSENRSFHQNKAVVNVGVLLVKNKAVTDPFSPSGVQTNHHIQIKLIPLLCTPFKKRI